MAWHPSVNQTPITSAIGVFNWLTELIAAGWTKISDSDGTTYSSSGTQVTGGGSGTNGLGNTKAWVCMKDPAGKTQFTFQRGTDNQHWRACHSPVDGFITGSPAATVCPTAADEAVTLGSGTEASPSFTQWFTGTEASMRFNSNALDTAPYTWWVATWPVGGGTNTGCGFFDGVVSPITGVGYTSDDDPHVVNFDSSSSPWSSANYGAAIYTHGNKPSANVMAAVTGIDFPFSAPQGGLSTDPDTGKDQTRPLEFYFTGGNTHKGITQNILWEMTGTTSSSRPLGYLLSISATGDHVVVGTAAIPWPSGTTPTI